MLFHLFETPSRLMIAASLLLAVSGAVAEPMSQDDLAWLKKIVAAAHRTDYSGTFIYQSGSYVETSRITHLFDGENEDERLEGLDGERSEIIRKNDQVWCYKGENKTMVAIREGARTFPALLPEQLTLLEENYVISHGPGDRVAGFPAHSMLFQARDNMRYAHRMWADSNSGLLLKADVLDGHGHVIEQYVFTQLQIGGDIDRKWVSQNKAAETKSHGKKSHIPGIQAAVADSGWQVYALPVGFKKITEVSRRLGSGDLPVTHLVYSDGLAGISVFIERIGAKPVSKTGLYNKGIVHIFIKVLDDNLLTVVGEVPPRTVMQVAESVRYGGKRQ